MSRLSKSTVSKKKIPPKLSARMLDYINYAFSDVYIPQIHLILSFKGNLSFERLYKALRLFLDKEPVFGCRFNPSYGRPYWSRLGKTELDNATILNEVWGDAEELLEKQQLFLAEPLDLQKDPQLKALLLHGTDEDILIIKVTHLVVDAGGTKELGYSVAKLYTKLGEEPNFMPEPNMGSRSLRQVYSEFTFIRLFQIYFQYFKEFKSLSFPSNNMVFPSGMDMTGDICFSFLRFSTKRVGIFTAYCKERQATLNDLFIAALFHAVAEASDWNGKDTLRMLCSVDLRRYLPNQQTEALCNLSGLFIPNLGQELGENLEQTLLKVKEVTDEYKNNNIGLSFLLADKLLFFPMPFMLVQAILKSMNRRVKTSGNAIPGMTNLGLINEDLLNFDGLKPERAEVLAPPMCAPFITFGLSGYGGTLTLSTGYFPSAIPPDDIEKLFQCIDAILP